MTSNNGSGRSQFGPYEVDLYTHELWKHGLRLKLVGQPFEILAMLLAKPGELVTRKELRSRLWPGDTFVDFNHGLNAAVNKLREALSDSAENPRYIETLPRRGYRFIAAVEGGVPQSKADSEVAVLTEPAPVTERHAAADQPVTPVTRETSFFAEVPAIKETKEEFQTSRRRIPILSAVLLLALFAFLLWFFSSHGSPKALVARAPSIPAVPLTNLPDPTSDPAFAPDGNRVAFRRQGYAPGTSGIFVKPIGSPQLLQLTNDSTDCCPVWSPNGRSIAFSRFSDKQHDIYTVPSAGGALRKLYSTEIGSRRGDLAWSPDGDSIAFVGQSSQGTSSIFMLSLKDLTARRITETPLLNNDWGPSFSPDGEHLGFVRTRETGLPENIVVMPAAGGESRVVVRFFNGILGTPAWAADGQSIVFAAGADPGLLRSPISGERGTDITEVASPASHPAISRRGYRLAYQKMSKAVSVWQMDFTEPARPHSRSVVVTDIGRNEGAQVSPDGKKLVFMSSRAGKLDIWISDRDGSNPRQLTAMGDTGTPRWSPDGRSIAFDANWHEHEEIFVVDIAGGSPRTLMPDNADSHVPNWSRDGNWIYFASARTGDWQVWKVPSAGGSPVQVTAHGGFAAYESPNGRTLYYSRTNMPNPEVWSMPVEGGVETRISLVRPETWANWAPVKRGIYFVEVDPAGEPDVMFFDFASARVTRMGSLDKLPFWLSASPDGKSVLYEHLDQETSHIMLVENFR